MGIHLIRIKENHLLKNGEVKAVREWIDEHQRVKIFDIDIVMVGEYFHFFIKYELPR